MTLFTVINASQPHNHLHHLPHKPKMFAPTPPQTQQLEHCIHLQLNGLSLSTRSETDDFSLNSQASSSQRSSPTNSSLTSECRPTIDNNCQLARRSPVSLLNTRVDATDDDDEPMALFQARPTVSLRGSPLNHREQALSLPPTLATPTLLDPSDRVRRPSRSERRRSFYDLGYGKVESYARLQRLGKGTYATVYLGRSRLNNDLVALKEIHQEHDEGAPCTAIREVSLLRLLRHNNIVTLHDICHTPKKLILVFEFVGPDLYAYMKENNHLLSINNIRLLLYQLLRGIAFCHSRQVLHRDLKPQNLLINSRGELKICDFGLARAKSIPTKSYSNEVVTLWYRPPDVLLGNTDYDCSIDMWGIGCIFYEMVSGRTFFPGSNVRQQLYLIFSNLGSPNKYNWPEILNNEEYKSYDFPNLRAERLFNRLPRLDASGINLLMRFLRYRPSDRVSAEVAKRDHFFACLPEEVHHASEKESIFDIPGIYMTANPGQRLNHL